ncbi:ABC transporter ATP-binding protein [Amorphus sp. 3PC139-8]|uniref:ABC transporter ATP-binding protein n=1 Tax=Amorphus sp. 3PC139-8 TaxID=2735676 RepID=UPI00345C8C9F
MGVLNVSGVSKSFAVKGQVVKALDAVDLEVHEGEFVSVIGPSGCGKSTLFSIIGGLQPDYDGRIEVDGRPAVGSHHDIGMVFQEESTFPWRTALENVVLPLQVSGVSKKERDSRGRELIRMVGLEGFEGHYPSQLSGGMKQRISIARTFAFEPRIMLMDEPFGALDEQTRLLLCDKLLEICQSMRQTTLLITHNITEAVQMSDRVVIMSYRPGRIKRIIDIDLPRPRTSDALSSPEFGEYVGEIWRDLRTEASKGMAAEGGARAASGAA